MLERARSMIRLWEDEPQARPQLTGSLLWLVGAIANTVSMVLAEQHALNHGQSLSGAQIGHLTGFAWGIGAYVVFRHILPQLRWWRALPPLHLRLQGRRGGRVLGRGGTPRGGRALGGAGGAGGGRVLGRA